MKYKKLILILSIFIIAFTYIIHPIIEENYLLQNPFIGEEEYDETNNEDVIRFHVRANSDSQEDQNLKLKVRDEILKEMGEKFEDTVSIDESRLIIKENIEEIKSIAENVIAQENKDYLVDVSLGIEEFPVRTYGNLVFPQGDYEALVVEIGEAKGQNWWCVMFPPLCFVDVVHTYAYVDAESQLGDYIVDENQPLKLKSKIVDFVTKINNKEDVENNTKEVAENTNVELENREDLRENMKEAREKRDEIRGKSKDLREKSEESRAKREEVKNLESSLSKMNKDDNDNNIIPVAYWQNKAIMNYVE